MALLFTYGTLQSEEVQQELFGRKLKGKRDFLKSYRLGTIQIPEDHPHARTYFIAYYTGNQNDKIEGTVYELKDIELPIADNYEGNSYERQLVTLNSKIEAFIYCRGYKN